MPRIARVVYPGVPHHVVQRGNNRQNIFPRAEDYNLYLQILAESCKRYRTELWVYCLMSNHVHLIAVPHNETGLAKTFSEAHRRYTQLINYREDRVGHLFQARFKSFPMDEKHLLRAARYIELNPVAAGMVQRARDYLWSSALAHIDARPNPFIQIEPILERMPEWESFLEESTSDEDAALFEEHTRTGKPLGTLGTGTTVPIPTPNAN